MKANFWIITILFLVTACISENKETNEQALEVVPPKEWRIVSLNGTITELLYEFGLGDKIVGIDVTSTYPNAVHQIANLGHTSQLNAEAILALKPNLILIDENNQNNKVLETIKAAGVAIQTITIPQTLDGVLTASQQLETILEQKLNTDVLKQKIERNQQAIQSILSTQTSKPKVLFIYARGAQAMMVAGKNTFAEKMIETAGGTAVVQEFESFKPLTPEALFQYQPEVILMFDSGLKSLKDPNKNTSAEEQLFAIQGMGKTPAGKNKRVITMEGLYLSGFGPRASDAALELTQRLFAN